MSSANNNQALIDGLRKAIEFIEATPDLPTLSPQSLRIWAWSDMDLFRKAAQHLGSFTKKFTDHYFELHKSFNANFEIVASLDREAVCKKIVTWECPDDESLLKSVVSEEAKDVL